MVTFAVKIHLSSLNLSGLKTLSNNLFRIINAADDIIMIYSIDDHIDIEKNNYLLGFKSLFKNKPTILHSSIERSTLKG